MEMAMPYSFRLTPLASCAAGNRHSVLFLNLFPIFR
jgi:hypothetical protein